jgi:hypothetical protein
MDRRAYAHLKRAREMPARKALGRDAGDYYTVGSLKPRD